MKTNAARLLDTLGIAYRLATYPVGEEHLAAPEVARLIGMPPERVWKTLVARGDRTGVLFAVLRGDRALDLKGLAKLSGNRKCETVALKEVQALTGYVRGGTTALAAKRAYPTFVDAYDPAFEIVSVSAGVRGTQLLLAPADYVRVTKATVGAIAAAADDEGAPS